MMNLKSTIQIVTVVALLSVVVPTAQAQQTDTGGATNTAATGATTGSATLSTEVDTAAFESIDRGETVGGGGQTGGFALGENTGTAAGAGGGGLGAFGGLGGLGGLSNLFGGGLGGNAQSSKPIIRTRLRSAIRVAPMAPANVQRSATTRLRQIPTSNRQLSGVNVQMAGRTAVVSGTVRNESDRRMTELLLRLEPGVSRVENRVVVLP